MQDQTHDADGEIEFLWKTDHDGGPSYTGSCMALYRGSYRGRPGWFTQHEPVSDPAVRARLEEVARANGTPLAQGEEFGWVPDPVISQVRTLDL